MIFAKKINMTQVFREGNQVVPVTILDYSQCFAIKGGKKSGSFIAIGKKSTLAKQKKESLEKRQFLFTLSNLQLKA